MHFMELQSFFSTICCNKKRGEWKKKNNSINGIKWPERVNVLLPTKESEPFICSLSLLVSYINVARNILKQIFTDSRGRRVLFNFVFVFIVSANYKMKVVFVLVCFFLVPSPPTTYLLEESCFWNASSGKIVSVHPHNH